MNPVAITPRAAFLGMLILTCAGLGGLAGCASVPHVDPNIGQMSGVAAKPEIIGARGPLTAQQSKALLDRISTEPGDAGVLQRHLAIEEAVAESPLIAGNRTRILRDGPASFAAMFSAIQGATNINLEYFIFEDVESEGVSLGDLLVAKRQAGVAVNVIYDSYGSSSTPTAFFDRLKEAGVNLVAFNPANPLEAKVELLAQRARPPQDFDRRRRHRDRRRRQSQHRLSEQSIWEVARRQNGRPMDIGAIPTSKSRDRPSPSCRCSFSTTGANRKGRRSGMRTCSRRFLPRARPWRA